MADMLNEGEMYPARYRTLDNRIQSEKDENVWRHLVQWKDEPWGTRVMPGHYVPRDNTTTCEGIQFSEMYQGRISRALSKICRHEIGEDLIDASGLIGVDDVLRRLRKMMSNYNINRGHLALVYCRSATKRFEIVYLPTSRPTEKQIQMAATGTPDRSFEMAYFGAGFGHSSKWVGITNSGDNLTIQDLTRDMPTTAYHWTSWHNWVRMVNVVAEHRRAHNGEACILAGGGEVAVARSSSPF